MTWGLNKNGFDRPNQAEIREDLDEQQRELFGADVNLNDKSPNGIINGILSYTFSKLWELAEKVWHSSHPSQAEGKQLDYLTVFFGTQRRRNRYAMGTIQIKGTPGYTVPYGRIYERNDGSNVQYMQLEDCLINVDGNGFADVTAITYGESGNAPANTLTVPVEPDSDVISVINYGKIEGGVNEETDEELRVRLEASQSSLGSGTINAIYSDLIAVPNVRAVRIKVNETSEIVDGNPPHSISVYVLGGDGKEIGEALMKNYTGISFNGTNPVFVQDVGGNQHVLYYTRAYKTQIKSKVTIKVNEQFSTNGIKFVQDAIVKVIGGLDNQNITHNGLNMGEDVVYMQVANAVMNVVGVTDVSLLLAGGDNPLKAENVVIQPDSVAEISVNDIEVVIS